MAELYTALARVYETARLHQDSERLRQRLFDKIQFDGWLGRHILDLGCGIGEGAIWFATNGFRVTAIDQSALMLEQAQKKAAAAHAIVDWRHGDFRQMDMGDSYDLVLAMNTLNELRRAGDLENVLHGVNRALSTGKMLLFDLITIQGLAEQWGNSQRVIHDDEDILVLVRSSFSYETLINTQIYTIFYRDEAGWHREDETHLLRGFPLQTVGPLLQRTGFRVLNVLNPALELFDPNDDRSGRAIFMAVKERSI